jgi:hypothetical protein
MQSEQQYEQLLMQYQQLKNGAEDIANMIEREDFDSAITLLKTRESLFLNCKCMLKYLELTPVQKNEIDKIVNELKTIELNNIKNLEKGMEEIQLELSKTQKSQKLQHAYGNSSFYSGNVVNIQE